MPARTLIPTALSKTESYTLSTVAKMARVNIDFIIECERESIVCPIVMEGQKRFDYDALQRLVRARHLHQNLGMELTAIDCIFRMRKQILSLQQELYETQKRTAEREQELHAEINRLQRQLSLVAVTASGKT